MASLLNMWLNRLYMEIWFIVLIYCTCCDRTIVCLAIYAFICKPNLDVLPAEFRGFCCWPFPQVWAQHPCSLQSLPGWCPGWMPFWWWSAGRWWRWQELLGEVQAVTEEASWGTSDGVHREGCGLWQVPHREGKIRSFHIGSGHHIEVVRQSRFALRNKLNYSSYGSCPPAS